MAHKTAVAPPGVRRPAWLARSYTALAEMSKLKDDWNGYGSEAPNDIARSSAREVLDLLADMDFAPLNVAPSAENGVGISFRKGERYALIECYNTDEIGAVVSRGVGHADSWDVSPSELKEALERIYDHIHGALA